MEEFIKYVKDEREEFVNVIRKQDWNNELRTAAESLLIAYDQMAAKLEECEGKADSTSEKDLRVCEVSKQGLFAEYLSQAMNTFGAKVEVQYVDYSKGTWTAPVRLTESRINQITNDNSVKNIRLSFPF